jgi:hypothetical protein
MNMLDTNTLNIANSSNGTSLTSDLIGYSCLIISSVFYGGILIQQIFLLLNLCMHIYYYFLKVIICL